MKHIALYLFALLGLSSCHNSKDSAKTPATADTTKSIQVVQTNDSTVRFLASFYSIGMGTEGDQIDRLKIFVTDFGRKAGKTIEYDEVPWGREGEVNYCFPLKELSAAQQLDFIKGARETLKEAQWVHLSENTVCRKK